MEIDKKVCSILNIKLQYFPYINNLVYAKIFYFQIPTKCAECGQLLDSPNLSLFSGDVEDAVSK